ncbi:MAG: hypothetical protein ABSH10_04670 [Phycisphaerae bacterium]|jgi:hypothetical protein
MIQRPRIIQVLWLLTAAGLLAAAGLILPRLAGLNAVYEVGPAESVARTHPEAALLTIAPGGLRAPVVNYLWIRAENLKDAGRYYDAMQLADLICALQPRFPGVWSFHAWNMAWNISVAMHTPEERWLWVTNGMRLLRDKGIPLNPRALLLYKDLAWIFYQKIGSNLDDMHMVYKQRWVAEMQHLLGAPPPGATAEVIDAFRPIAQAPLDKTTDRQGRDLIQDDQLRLLEADPNVAEYVRLLEEQGIPIDRNLLDAYNRFSREQPVEMVRIQPPTVSTPQDKAVSALINNPQYAAARAKLLAFVRAQLLWNEYKMDPAWMLALMEKYQVPIDWRLPWPHGLYWASYGLKVSNDTPIEAVNSLNTDRIALGCMKALVAAGRLTYLENPDRPNEPSVDFWGDWRYIDAAQREYLDTIDVICKAEGGTPFTKNILRGGHINFLILSFQMLYVQGQVDRAEYYFDWVKKTYGMKSDEWDQPLDEFIIMMLNKDRNLISEEVARTQLAGALQMAYYFLAVDNMDAYNRDMKYAARVYEVYQKSNFGTEYERLHLQPFEAITSHIAAAVLVDPYCAGYYLPLMGRVQLYSRLDDATRVLAYDRLVGSQVLQEQCRDEGLDFNKAFPQPPGLEQYRQQQLQKLAPGQPPPPRPLPPPG